jgi:hypothetical protein
VCEYPLGIHLDVPLAIFGAERERDSSPLQNDCKDVAQGNTTSCPASFIQVSLHRGDTRYSIAQRILQVDSGGRAIAKEGLEDRTLDLDRIAKFILNQEEL